MKNRFVGEHNVRQENKVDSISTERIKEEIQKL
jgi:hypothetical protein